MDEADVASNNEMMGTEALVRQRMAAAAAIPVGEPGECDMCGEWTGRLVGGACARCRDRYKLP